MSTVATVIERVRRRVNGPRRPTLDQLKTTLDSSETGVVFKFADRGPGSGGYFEIGTELFYCVNQDDTEIIAMRAQGGSTGAAHTAEDPIVIEPDPAATDVLDALLTAINQLPIASVARVVDEDLAMVSTKSYVPLATADALGILGRGRVVPASGNYVTAHELDLTFIKDPDNDLGGSAGSGVRVPQNAFVVEDQTVNVYVATPFVVSTFVSSTDLIATVGLDALLEDAITYFAAAEILEGQEGMRAQTDAAVAVRSSTEVVAGQSAQLSQLYRSQGKAKVGEAAVRFRRKFGGWYE